VTKEDILDLAESKAYQYELVRSGCSSAVVLAILETFSLMDEKILKAASGFAGGIGGTHNVCGALSGGVIVLGLKYGWGKKEIDDLIDKAADKRSPTVILLVRKLVERFKREYECTSCHDMQLKFFGRTFNGANPEDAKEFERLGGHTEVDGKPAVCPTVAGKAARWVAELILKEEENRRARS
jgi:C_GCAxxG_C_C family probable redox protein